MTNTANIHSRSDAGRARLQHAQRELNGEVSLEPVIKQRGEDSEKRESNPHPNPDQYENQKEIYLSRRQAFYKIFTKDMQDVLEEDLKNWPTYRVGYPMPGLRARMMHLLNLYHLNPESHNICDTWMKMVGWSILGRNTYIDDEGTIWGPSPYGHTEKHFPYSRATFHKRSQQWLLHSDDPLYDLFCGGVVETLD